MKTLLPYLLLIDVLAAGSFSPAANKEGTSAVPLDDRRIARWADAVVSYTAGEDVDAMWRKTDFALGPATANPTSVMSLGRGGEIVLEFNPPIKNGRGFDFAVFENSFAHTFLELAFVEVSTDGVTYQRFTNTSETRNAVGPFGFLDASEIDGLAGKYIGGFGTPFDLSTLENPPSEVRFVKLIDVIGGTSLDSSGNIIFDPFPTQGSAGFDLSGIAVLETEEIASSAKIVGENFVLTWQAVPGKFYLIRSASDPAGPWLPLVEKEASQVEEGVSLPLDSDRNFYQVILK